MSVVGGRAAGDVGGAGQRGPSATPRCARAWWTARTGSPTSSCPRAVAFLALGQVLVGALFQTGRFSAANSRYVWAILAGSAVGLLASTLSRLSSSAFYALGDTRTPLRYAVVRVALTTVLGFLCAVPAAAAARPRAQVGRRRAHGERGVLGLGGVRAAPAQPRRRASARRHFVPGYLAKLWVSAAGRRRGGLGALAGDGPARSGEHRAPPSSCRTRSSTAGSRWPFRIPAAQAILAWSRRRG